MRWALLVVLSVSVDPITDPIRIDPTTGHYVDAHGRARVFHGVNVVYKTEPWYPASDHWDNQTSLDKKTLEYMREWGFNVVRLGVMWPGVERQHGKMEDQPGQYLDEIGKLVDSMAEYGIYTIADLHQDVGSRRFCGEGFPEFYVEDLYSDNESAISKASQWPEPFLSHDDLHFNATGFPDLGDCLKKSFGRYYITEAVGALWESLYTAGSDLNNGFIRYWKSVATKFKNSPALLAFELLNEPSGYCLDSSTISCLSEGSEVFGNAVEGDKLTPLYQAAAQAIREVGAPQIILYEATVLPKIAGDLFPELPLGQNETQQGLAYHIYCAPGDGAGGIVGPVCEITQDLFWDTYHPFLDKHKSIGGFLTEFGAVGGNEEELDHLSRVMSTADETFQSWTYWQLKKYNDFTTANAAEAIWDGDGNIEMAKVKTLTRTYAQAIAGKPSKMTFDADTADFVLEYIPTITSAPTEIYLNSELHYPDGFKIEIKASKGVPQDQLTKCLTYKMVETNYMHLTLSTSDACKIFMHLYPKVMVTVSIYSAAKNKPGTMCDTRPSHFPQCSNCPYGTVRRGLNDWCCEKKEKCTASGTQPGHPCDTRAGHYPQCSTCPYGTIRKGLTDWCCKEDEKCKDVIFV